jgi:hypothetical protein
MDDCQGPSIMRCSLRPIPDLPLSIALQRTRAAAVDLWAKGNDLTIEL